MNAIVIEHVPVAELPSVRGEKLARSAAHITVRIEEETQIAVPMDEAFTTDDPAFGIWRDCEDMADVQAHVRRFRVPR